MQAKKKILVVDDEADIVEMIQTALESASYQVVTACNGREAMEKTRAEKPDAIILDLMMPEMDGFTVARELKNADDTSHIPILALTAFPQKGPTEGYVRDLGHQLLTDDYLPKPVDPNRLLSRLKELLEL